MFWFHNAAFERVIGKHYTSVDRLINGEDSFPYSDMEVIFKRQFTGLKDKNGVEIYEGDIVYLSGYGNYECEFPFLQLYDSQMECDVGSVVGNIYESKDLLK